MIETYAYACAGILGNPSDGYFGRTLAMSAQLPGVRFSHDADMLAVESLDDQ